MQLTKCGVCIVFIYNCSVEGPGIFGRIAYYYVVQKSSVEEEKKGEIYPLLDEFCV